MALLHVHSHYSLLEGTAGVRALVARAVEYEVRALALVDTEGMFGAVPFYKAARGAGLRPILGALVDGYVLLAKDREGYAQLCEVVTARRLGHCNKLVDWPFTFGLDHLFLLSYDRAVLSALQARGFDVLAGVAHYGDQRSRRRAGSMVAWARERGLRAVAAAPVYFLDPGHYRIHRVLSAIRGNTTVDTLPPGALADPGAWFRPPGELERLYADWPETLQNAEGVAEECHVDLPLGKPLFPGFPLPAGETPFSWLWKKTFEGLKERYRPLTRPVIDRVRYELDMIDALGFAPYFLIVWDIVRFAREQSIPIVGRGSAANSLVAYALGITRVDPFKYDLYFERFLNRARTDCPDIDLDICWRRRDDVIDYVYQRYGADRVAMICTLNTFRARAAVREVAKAHGLTDREIGEVARRLPHYGADSIPAAVKKIPECRGIDLDEEPLKSIVEIAAFIDGFPRHLSIHSGGVVIAPERLTRFLPLQRAPKGILITQYDMHPVEDLGLIKMDLLGHRSLTVIDDTIKTIQRNRGVTLDIETVPDGDRLTAAMLRAGKTIACFQIESPAMRGLLQKVGACDTHTLIQTIALVRPGASGSGMKKRFIDRRHGREAVSYLHPALETVLGDTYGIMIYQEDVLKVAHAVAGMDLTEADALRRAMSKLRSPREMAKSMRGFLDKARANGVGASVAQEIWELIANFAAYSYCKAHAATYGELAYQCAYLKAHYPAEFFAAVLSNRGGFYRPAVYLEEARRWGLEIRPPDVQRSGYAYTAEDDALRVGFVEIRDLKHESVEAILEAREERPFEGLTDFLERAALPPSDLEILFQAGALDGFGVLRPGLLWRLRVEAKSNQIRIKTDDNNLIKTITDLEFPIPDYSMKRRNDLEWQALGLLTREHPLQYYVARLQEAPLIASSELARHEGRIVSLAGWLITERRLTVKNGNGMMKFLTLEDLRGTFEAVLFHEAYQRYGPLLTSLGPYLLTGEIQCESGAHALIVEHVVLYTGSMN